MVMFRRKGEKNKDKKIFEKLMKFKDELQDGIGEKLEWETPRMSSNQSRYYVSTYYSVGDLESISESELNKASIWMAETTKKFVDVFSKIEKKL